MKIIMYMNDLEHIVMEFDLDIEKKEIRNVKIVNEFVANGFYPKRPIEYHSFEELLQYYMGGKYSLDKYINHIIKYDGLYTPYQQNMNIKIKK